MIGYCRCSTGAILIACGVLIIILTIGCETRVENIPSFQLTAQDGKFVPETLNVPAGKRFRIVMTNNGPGAEEFESHDLRRETVLAPGVTRTLVFAPLKPGVYPFFGEFHPATAKGRIVAE